MTDNERAELARLRKIETDEAKSPIALLAEKAWGAVRRSDDGVWNALPMGMKAKLVDLAAKYRGGARVAEGDYPPEGFAEKVAELAASADVASGVPVVFFDSRMFQTAPEGIAGVVDSRAPFDGLDTGIASPVEHEDTRIPPPNPEDVDPLGAELAGDPPSAITEHESDLAPAVAPTEFATAGADTPKEVTLPSTADAQPVKVIAPLGTGDVTVHGDGEPVVVKEGQSATFRKPKGSRKKGR